MPPKTPPHPIMDMADSFIRNLRAGLRPEDQAAFDLAITLELHRRGLNTVDAAHEMRLRAEEHRRRAPYISALLRGVADALNGNVVTLMPRKPVNPDHQGPSP